MSTAHQAIAETHGPYTPPPACEAQRSAERRAWRERKRAWRFLKQGGVVVREDWGGTIGIRWSRASRSGNAFDTAICEGWLTRGRLHQVEDATSCFQWTKA